MTDTTKTINGRKYRFTEDGAAIYDWYLGTVSNATPSNPFSEETGYYYNTAEQCWLASGWFKTIPRQEIHEEAYNDGEEYWFYGLNKGCVVTSEMKFINGQKYAFNEYGEMLHGLYKMVTDGKTIVSWQKIEGEGDFPGTVENTA